MTFSISMFTGSADLNYALNMLACTCFSLPRDGAILDLEDFQALFCSADGYQSLQSTARRFGLADDALPRQAELTQYFKDELLSRRALRMHAARNVYNTGKAILWQRLWLPFKPLLAPDDVYVRELGKLCAFDSSAHGLDKNACVDWLTRQLDILGFHVTHHRREGYAPILSAHRAAQGLRGRMIMYGHYDVVDAAPAQWNTPPFELSIKANRFYACGIGDNKAALLSRLQALQHIPKSPELLWIIQGEEEIGSPFAHEFLPELLHGQHATLWLEENGYHDLDGTQRILARTLGQGEMENLPPDRELWCLIDTLGKDAAVWGVKYRVESRGLNKAFFPTGCPFNKQIPVGARYLAIGVNDSASGIHHPNESVPVWTVPLHQRQLGTVFEWVDASSV